MSTAIAEERLTVEQFYAKYGHCSGVELVRGRVVWPGQERGVPIGAEMPKFKHGVLCNHVSFLLTQHVKAEKLGWVATNDTFVPTGQDPPSVLGADVLYVSFARVPLAGDEIPEELTVAPDLVVEVRSPTDRWGEVFTKIGDYLEAGVAVVVVLDPVTRSASVYRPDDRQYIFEVDDKLTLPDVLPGFSVPVRELFAASPTS